MSGGIGAHTEAALIRAMQIAAGDVLGVTEADVRRAQAFILLADEIQIAAFRSAVERVIVQADADIAAALQADAAAEGVENV